MRASSFLPAAAALALVLGAVCPAFAAPPEGWHQKIDDALEASAKSNKPLLVITAWARRL